MRSPVAVLTFGLLLVSFFIYFIFSSQSFWRGPQIAIDFPEEGTTLESSRVSIKGRGRDVTALRLNGRPIYTDEYGNFEEELILASGLNIIELKADGRFGRKISERKMVMVKLAE